MLFAPAQLAALLLDSLRLPLRRLSQSSGTARSFALQPEGIPPHVLLRHLAEHVMRIRMFRPLDAKATQLLMEQDSGVVDLWRRYARSEAVHDRYFLRDLAAVGISNRSIESLAPFEATQRLGRFVGHAMQEYGPLPVVLYSFWAEENSSVGSDGVHVRTQAVFGPGAARGALSHRALDDSQEHPALIARTLTALVQDADGLLVATQLLEELTLLLQAYFSELDEWGESPQAEFFRAVRPSSFSPFTALVAA